MRNVWKIGVNVLRSSKMLLLVILTFVLGITLYDAIFHQFMTKEERSVAVAMWAHRPQGLKSIRCSQAHEPNTKRECFMVFDIAGSEHIAVQQIDAVQYPEQSFKIVWNPKDPRPVKTKIDTTMNLQTIPRQEAVHWMTQETLRAVREVEVRNLASYASWMQAEKAYRSY